MEDLFTVRQLENIAVKWRERERGDEKRDVKKEKEDDRRIRDVEWMNTDLNNDFNGQYVLSL